MKPFTALLTAAVVLLSGATSVGQQAPTMNQEPHHQRLTYIRNMRVFLSTLAPGESTIDYVLDYDVVFVPLTAGTIRTRPAGEDWTAPRNHVQAGAVTVQVTGAPMTHRVENAGQAPFRAIVVENLRDRGWTTPPVLAAPGTTLQHENRSFAVYDMRLNAATPRTVHTHQNPSFIFLMSGLVQVQGGGGEFEFPLDLTRTWWFPGSGVDQPHTIELAGGAAEAHVMCVEAK
jgi:hypothetical protein